MISFEIPGAPVPKGRPRLGKGGRTFTPAKTKTAEQTAAWLCRAAMAGRKPLVGPVAISLDFTMADRRRVDIDNISKLLMDAFNGIAYADDSQIIELHATKSFDGEPGTRVTIQLAYP